MRGIGDLLFNTTPNEDMGVAATLTKNLLLKAKNDIKIISGALAHDFYEGYGISEALKQIVGNRRNLKVQIICGPNYDKKSRGIINLAKRGDINLYISNKYPEKHFLLIDDKNVRAEVSHTVKELNLLKTKGNVVKNSIFLGKKLAIEFEKIKEDSELFKIKN